MSRYRIPIFPVSIFQSSVRDNSRIQELVYPMIKKSSGKHDNPPDGWLTNKLITSFEDDEFNDSIISDDGPNKEIKDQYIEVMGSFFNESFECDNTETQSLLLQNYHSNKTSRQPFWCNPLMLYSHRAIHDNHHQQVSSVSFV